ncbi:MAG: type II toxin-antitoxin system HicB family antitoxin [Sandaracinaceae bacterium]|nr:type II toxin-antitoxin system HicB family antitoxin [Sandaracinaceae bacterium]
MGRRTSKTVRTKGPRHAILTFDGKWWTAEAPHLAGAYSQGRTRASALSNLRSAIRDLLDAYEQLGEEPPFREVAEVEVEMVEMAG